MSRYIGELFDLDGRPNRTEFSDWRPLIVAAGSNWYCPMQSPKTSAPEGIRSGSSSQTETPPTSAYNVGMATPSSIRFDPEVLRRLTAYVAAHPGTTLSSAGNRLVDEALRSQEHPLVIFRDGPAGRRARLVGGPDVWQIVRAVQSARNAEPDLNRADLVGIVSDTSGVPEALVRAAIAYWADYPTEVDAFVARAGEEEERARRRWEREQGLLAG